MFRRVSGKNLGKSIEQRRRRLFDDEQRAILGLDEILGDGVIEKLHQRIVVTGDIQ